MELKGNLGFLGYGNMASAILEGLIRREVIAGKQALVYDPLPERRTAAEQVGAGAVACAPDLGGQCDTVVLAVKPQMMETALKDLAPSLGPETLVISIAAGISIAYLAGRLSSAHRIIRVMPNTPALVQAGAAGIAPGANCTGGDIALARKIFDAIGIAAIVEEKDIDAVTALSGSGPAYFFYLVECLIDAAKAEGLDGAVAAQLAAQTLYGAGNLLHSSEDSAAVLREKVTSKGGTTEAALKQFRADGLADVVRAGVAAAAARSRELGA